MQEFIQFVTVTSNWLLRPLQIIHPTGEILLGVQGVYVALLIPFGIEIINDLKGAENALKISFLNAVVIRPVSLLISILLVCLLSFIKEMNAGILILLALAFLYQIIRLFEIYKWIMPPLEGIFSREEFQKSAWPPRLVPLKMRLWAGG